jgi:hypothetical protein
MQPNGRSLRLIGVSPIAGETPDAMGAGGGACVRGGCTFRPCGPDLPAEGAVTEEDVLLWRPRTGGIALKATTRNGDAVELTIEQARELAVLLLRMAAGEDP